jgi:uncharacterized protein YicC (UPF0701 family)
LAKVLTLAISDLQKMRQKEGTGIKENLQSRLRTIARLKELIAPRKTYHPRILLSILRKDLIS